MRALLSMLFILHWGAVASLVILDTAEERLPTVWLGSAFQSILAPIARLGWPLAEKWLDASGTRQSWMLFAPAPSDWAVSVIAIPWYGGSAPDTLVVPGPAEEPFPHWTRPRSYDLAFNLAYEGKGAFYQALEARRLCRGLRRGGEGPDSVTLGTVWQPLDPPWVAAAREPLYRTAARFECSSLLASPPRRNS